MKRKKYNISQEEAMNLHKPSTLSDLLYSTKLNSLGILLNIYTNILSGVCVFLRRTYKTEEKKLRIHCLND